MKTMNTILAAVTISAGSLFLSGNANAGDGMNLTPITSEKKVTVELRNPKSIDVSIFVSNDQGKILHEETIKSQRSYGRVYDFSALEDGVYNIVSEDDFIKTTTDFRIYRSDIEVLNNNVEYKPLFSTDEGTIMVNYLNIDTEDIKFYIESSKNDKLYKSEEGSDISFQKKLDISKMKPGDYYATLEVGKKSYSYYFYIR